MPRNPRILITDDEARMRKSIELLLQGRGLDIDTAGSGTEAVGYLANNIYDLLLLDMSLGDMNGYQVMEFAREYSPEAMIVIITGDASIESAVEALKKGAYSYLKKPFEPEELINTAFNAIEHKKLVTDQRKTTLALRESEKRFRNLVEDSLIGIAIIQDGRIVYQNPENRKLFTGRPASFSIDDFRCIHQDDIARVREAYLKLVSGKIRQTETSFRFYPPDKAGSIAVMKWVQCRASLFRYRGRPAILLNMMDITRTRELEHQVTIKNKLLSLGRIAAGIAHEIRNPLTGVNSHLYNLEQICSQDALDAEDLAMIQKIVTQVQAASNKIEGVIKRVLDFSKPSPTRKSLVNLNDAIKEAIDLSNVTLRKRGIHLASELSEDLPDCHADLQQLEQVFLNLIANASQTLEKQDRRKEIKIKSFFSGASVFFLVSDSGPGIPRELREQIFDPFFTTKSDGSGIGLSLAQRIIMDHNGSINVGESELGGAEFKIELPAANGDFPS